ncbi:hypothetical protein KXQ82_11420 [Mucilaginibacter sp. HMF5004]|uniref:hypothetical protein n=1 Tax=Mucilaginibacter rivuli TaxID=2857527 RepID=UPI001C607E01|nr:hypothetical protein [Mucilaginibacter rivuli]MBW4890333.1 hypothetical protein [Mucilaginibacter rivuli]
MLKNIRTIVPILASQFIDVDDDIELETDYNKFVIDKKGLLGGFYKYIDKLHDSWIINTNISADTYSITLNDFTTHVFADALVESKGLRLNSDKLVFPIRLDFQTTDISYNTVDDDGNISQMELTLIDEYLAEQVIKITDGIIEIGLVAWKNGAPGKRILILINAKSISVRDDRDEAWTKIFTSKYDQYYKYFISQLEKGIFLSDVTKCKKLIDEFDKN